MLTVYVSHRYNLSFCTCKTAWLPPELLFSLGPCLHQWFLQAKQRLLDLIYKSLCFPDLTCPFVHAKQHELHQIYKPLWVPELTCRFVHAKSMISTEITCLYGCQPSSVVFWYKTATFGPEWQVSIGLRPHLSFCTCKTERLVPELLVSMGARPHLWFLDAKQRLLEQNYMSLWVKDLTCGLSMKKWDLRNRITSLYGSQTWSVVSCMYNSELSISNTSLTCVTIG